MNVWTLTRGFWKFLTLCPLSGQYWNRLLKLMLVSFRIHPWWHSSELTAEYGLMLFGSNLQRFACTSSVQISAVITESSCWSLRTIAHAYHQQVDRNICLKFRLENLFKVLWKVSFKRCFPKTSVNIL